VKKNNSSRLLHIEESKGYINPLEECVKLVAVVVFV